VEYVNEGFRSGDFQWNNFIPTSSNFCWLFLNKVFEKLLHFPQSIASFIRSQVLTIFCFSSAVFRVINSKKMNFDYRENTPLCKQFRLYLSKMKVGSIYPCTDHFSVRSPQWCRYPWTCSVSLNCPSTRSTSVQFLNSCWYHEDNQVYSLCFLYR
jgi:hypothetical protein